MSFLAYHSLRNQLAAVGKADGMEPLQFVAVAASCHVVGVACHGLVVASNVVMVVVYETRGDPWRQPRLAPLYRQYQGYLVVLMTVVAPTIANCVAC